MPTARAPQTTPPSNFRSPAYRGDDSDEDEDGSNDVGNQEEEVSTDDIGELLAGKDNQTALKVLNRVTSG